MNRRLIFIGIVIGYLLLFWLGSCSLMRNSRVNKSSAVLQQEQSLAMAGKEQRDWSKNMESIFLFRDSSRQVYGLQLWPKGIFTYSATGGFTGEADSMRVIGSYQKALHTLSGKVLHEENSHVNEQQLSAAQQATFTTREKQKETSPSMKVVAAAVVCCGLLAGWLYLKQSNHKP